MTTPPPAQIRAWAKQQGLEVKDRGRLRPDVVAAWQAANGSAVPDRPAVNGAAAASVAPGSARTGAPQRRRPRSANPAGQLRSPAGAPGRSVTAAPTAAAASPVAAPATPTAASTATAGSVRPAVRPAAPSPQALSAVTPVDARELLRQLAELTERVERLEQAARTRRRGMLRRG